MARRARIMVLLAGLLLGGQLICAAPVAAQPPDQPPDVTGLTVRDARQALYGWNPKVGVVLSPVGGEAPRGTDLDLAVVVSQSSPSRPGVAAPQIDLSVTARVPDLLGLTRTAADGLIARAGLRGDPVPSDAPGGWIVRNQSPAPGTVAKWRQPVSVGLAPPPSSAAPEPAQFPTVPAGSPAPARPPRLRASAAILAAGSALFLLLLLLSLLGLLLTRARRRRRPSAARISARLRETAAATVRLDRSGTRPDITVTVTRREVAPDIRIEEVRQ